jgi:hypothetical protein
MTSARGGASRRWALAVVIGATLSSWSVVSAAEEPPPPLHAICGETGRFHLAPGQAICDEIQDDGKSTLVECSTLAVSAFGTPLPTVAPPGASKPSPPGNTPRPATLVAHVVPPVGPPGAILRLDVQAPGYEDAHVDYHADVGGPLCVALRRRPNVRIRVEGEGAAASVYAVVDRKIVDKCAVDVEARRPSCDLYVPAPSSGALATAQIRIVGTASGDIENVPVRDRVLTELTIGAARRTFTLPDYLVVGGIAAGGLALSGAFVKAGEDQGGNVAFDALAAGTTVAAAIGALVTTVVVTKTRIHWVLVYRDVNGQPVHIQGQDLPEAIPGSTQGFSLAEPPSRSSPVSVGLVRGGLALRW